MSTQKPDPPHDHDHGHAGKGGHSHGHAPAAGDTRAIRALSFALVLTAGFMVVEFAASALFHSTALKADAWHMLSDVGSLALAMFATTIAVRPRSRRKTFGYKRVEVLAALLNGVLLGVAAVLVVSEALSRLQHPAPVSGEGVLGIGIAGLVVNLIAAALLHRGSDSLNVRAALAHVIGDALGSCAAIVAGAVIALTGDTRADPALSLLVAGILLWSAWRLVAETSHVLLEGAPEGLDPHELERTIGGVAGVASVHDVHVWSISQGEPAVMAHVVLASGGFHGDQVAQTVCDVIHQRYGIHHVTIQPEPPPPGIVQLGFEPGGRPEP